VGIVLMAIQPGAPPGVTAAVIGYALGLGLTMIAFLDRGRQPPRDSPRWRSAGLLRKFQRLVAARDGPLLLAEPSRPDVGFRAEAIVLIDSATGMVGRSVWTDDRGDQVYSELRGEGTATGNRIVGTFLGGTGRYSGATGTYEFSWRFVLEAEDGTVQGQSVGLKGRVRVGQPPGAPGVGGSRP